MSKRKVSAAFEELTDWFTNMDRKSIDGVMSVVGRLLASLPGGDEFEDLGYEPIEGIGWHEFELIHNALMAIDDKMDVEQAAEILFHGEGDEDDEDEDEEDDDE